MAKALRGNNTAIIVLLAVDSSPQSELAFHWYLDHLHHSGNSIVILHSIDLDAISDDNVEGSEPSIRLWDQSKSKIKALDDKFRWKLNENGLPGKIRTETGKPGEVIVRVAVEEKVGMIVIGSRGLSKIKRTLAGSVSDYVLHHAKCPVVICKQKE
jgi:nucleotide-binding universal stress UspA family protein